MPPRQTYNERRVRVYLYKTTHARADMHMGHIVNHTEEIHTESHKKIEPIRSSEPFVI